MSRTDSPAPLFHEEQRFRQPWLWTLLGGVALAEIGIFGYGMIQQFVLGRPWGDRPMSDPALLLAGMATVLFSLGLLALFLAMRLVTEVREDGLSVRFFPFHLRETVFRPGEIQSSEAVEYRPLLDYGGWGIRYGRGGKAYNVSGNRGVRLEFADGKRLLIGSQRADELAAAIRDLRRGTPQA